ncbi:MAG TPA: AraC family transcriptional regulator, partial [Prolixibacteraceae bacterium]|jgi:AraC-like DNA-binding protein
MEFRFTTINIPDEKSFSVQKQTIEEFSVIHAHKAYELNLITSGSGKRIVGNNVSSFEGNDLILIGPDLPHSRELSESQRDNPPECLVLYISESLVNRDLIHIRELDAIHRLFSQSLSGLAFKGKGVSQIEQQMLQLENLHGSDSFIALIKLLKNLTEIEEQEILSLTPELTVDYHKDLEQIKTVYDFVLRNIQDTITLDMVSGLLNMAPGSFCRFFKKRTGKSFLQYVKDIRISIASKMLSGTEKPIAQICFESGYNNLANFNFYFKSIMKMTPSE